MPLWFIPALFALFVILCLAAGIWLLLHLTAVAALFRGKADIVPSRKPPRASRGAVIVALSLFSIGLAGVLAMQILTMTGGSNAVVTSR